jgi:hypothetical protein
MGYKRMKKKEIRVNKKFREGNKILAKGHLGERGNDSSA